MVGKFKTLAIDSRVFDYRGENRVSMFFIIVMNINNALNNAKNEQKRNYYTKLEISGNTILEKYKNASHTKKINSLGSQIYQSYQRRIL